jgi:hypothetical protein
MKKYTIKKLEPIRMLPKAHEHQWRSLLGQVNNDNSLKSALQVEKSKINDSGKIQTEVKHHPDKEEPEENGRRSARHKAQVAFNSHNTSQAICEDLLKQGYLEAFHDFFTLTMASTTPSFPERLALSEQQMSSLRNSLVHAEEEMTQGNFADACEVYMDVAEKYLETGSRQIAKYFFTKIIVLTERVHSESNSNSKSNYFQLFINAKLGLVKCLDQGKEGMNALSILEEIFLKTEIQKDFRNQVAKQLIELYKQQAATASKAEDLDLALEYCEKCLKVCVGAEFGKEEYLVALQVSEIYKRKKEIDKAIANIKGYIAKTNKLDRESAAKFEVSSYKLLAECYEVIGEMEEAENSYRNFYELLKVYEGTTDDHKAVACQKLGDIYWSKEKRPEAVKYYHEYFEETLKAKVKEQKAINNARVTLSVARAFDEFEDFAEYLQLSKNKFDDVLAYKKNRRIS